MRTLMKRAYNDVRIPRVFVLLCLSGVLVAGTYPSNLPSYRPIPAAGATPFVHFTNDYLRFANTLAQAGLPVFFGDEIGMAQVVYVALGTTAVTQGLKFLVNKWEFGGTRLGERPNGVTSNHNKPSGHSSMASCAVYYVSRRYGLWHLVYLVPIMLLTMYARVALGSHTVAAVIAGALVGLMMAAIFTSGRSASGRVEFSSAEESGQIQRRRMLEQ